MTMLIRAGLIHTMTAQGSFVGDILVRGNRIVAVAPSLSLPAEHSVCILDATELNILPGMLDVHIHDGSETDVMLLRSPHASGVTSGVLWPEQEGRCRLLTSDGMEDIAIEAIQPSRYTGVRLHERIRSIADEGCRVACEIHSPEDCKQVLDAVRTTQVKVLLVHLTGCESFLKEFVHSGCPVVLGVNHHRSSNPWAMACKLDQLGVTVALTCNYPDTKLCHLPLCGALCAREGMDRERVLRMVTAAPAAISGLSDRGVIKVGARADFAIYDGDPLLLATSHVMTIAGGKIRH